MDRTSISHRVAGLSPALLFGIVALVLGAPAPILRAQDSGQPARAIRLAYVDGKVQLAQDGQVIAEQAVANTPLLQGMTLTTAEDGRVEIQFEDGSVARLAPGGSLTLKVLTGSGASADAEMDLDRGLAYFELQGNDQNGQMRVRFGDAVATASGFTVLRIRDDTPPGDVAVLSGNAHIERGSSVSLDVHGGESVSFTPSDPNNYLLADTIEPDSWDAWNSDRDQALTAEASSQTDAPQDIAGGNPQNPAWNDLDASGTWYNVPDQGYVWSPYEASNASFDPYGNGNWVWTPGYGYIWASGYSWGYMPYQCGAWNFYNGFGWGWAPGMGGCNPWWNTGYYGGPVIGYAPGWYPGIHRPREPKGPHFGGPNGPVRGRPVPVITVHRDLPDHGLNLPPRNRDNAININGHMLQGLRGAPSRTGNERSIFTNRTIGSGAAPGQPSGNRPGYSTPRPIYAPRQGFNGGQQPGSITTQPGRGFAPPNRGTYEPPRANPEPGRTITAPSVPRNTDPRPNPEPSRPVAPPNRGNFGVPNPNPQPTHTNPPPSPPAQNPGGWSHPGNSGGGGGGSRPSPGGGSAPPSGGGGGNSGGGGGFHGGGGGGNPGGGGGHSGGGGNSGSGGHR